MSDMMSTESEIKFLVTNENSNTIVFHSHQGLGDLICCSPIANFLSERYPSKKILYFTKGESYAKNLRRFCNPAVEIAVLDNHAGTDIVDKFVRDNNCSLIRTGFENYFYDPSDPWDYSFYRAIGVDYSVKTSHFFLDRNIERERELFEKLEISKDEAFAFVHDDPTRGLTFSPSTIMKVVKNSSEYEVADFAGVLEKASELHFMGSSMMCFADVLDLPKESQKAYYYTFRGSLNARNIERWIKIQT